MKNTEGNIDIGITKEEFLGVIKLISPNLDDRASRLFDLYDEDNS